MKNGTILVAGASGATGRLLVEQLLKLGLNVKAIVRSPERLPEILRTNDRLFVIQANIDELTDDEMAQYIKGCFAVASCLGHNLGLKGLFGHPRRLVTDATIRMCRAIKSNNMEAPTRLVLMNTAGNSNRDLNEPISFGQNVAVGLIRLLLPPHADNEDAADYLRTQVGKKEPSIQWAAVRPDNLIDKEQVTEYEVHPSPIRSAIFNAGKTSRINVAHFMAELIVEDNLWTRWKGEMPVIYNVE